LAGKHRFLEVNAKVINSYSGEFIIDYSWSEFMRYAQQNNGVLRMDE